MRSAHEVLSSLRCDFRVPTASLRYCHQTTTLQRNGSRLVGVVLHDPFSTTRFTLRIPVAALPEGSFSQGYIVAFVSLREGYLSDNVSSAKGNPWTQSNN